ncbi:MAG TPA: CoA transferase [Candidatus Sulfomarinibacteraceae bacterium]|nr:CoA transferase [Candidatus Sulfomarinibacteraceae bacterium]
MGAPGRPAPLAGLRVIAVEQYGAGPFGSMYLADLGADVVKVEDPGVGGDISRYIPPGVVGSDSLFFEAFNRNKRGVALDLKHPGGREVFERLVVSADAVYSNLRGDQPARLRIRYGDLAALNPRIVCVAVSGYGDRPDQAKLPGYDALIQAESGWASLTGDPDGPPTKSGLSLVDYITGLTAALGLLAGVLQARSTGVGRDIDTNLYDSALAMLSYPATWYLSAGYVSQRRPLSAHPSVVPFQFFATADGYVAIACPKEKFFTTLAASIGVPDLATDPRFATFAARDRHRDETLEILEARFASRSTAEWLETLRGVVPIAPVRSLQEALDPDELQGRGMLATYDHPTLGLVRSVGLPLRVTDFTPSYRPGPALGQDQDEVLTAVGYGASEIVDLRLAGAFGPVGEPANDVAASAERPTA